MAGALAQRIATAAVLAPLAVVAMLALPTPYFALVFALVLAVGAGEWAALAGIRPPAARLAYAVLVAGSFALLWPVRDGWGIALIGGASLFWLGTAAALARVREVAHRDGLDPTLLALGVLVLLVTWLAVVKLHALAPNGRGLVLFLFVLIWVADSFAFLAGRRWGRAKLAPALSPGKTWVGVCAGVVGAALCGFVLAWADGLQVGRAAAVIALCALAAGVSVVGDLFESLLKRRRGIKDSSRLLPGHGGILDRIDSLLAAAPIFALGILWLEGRL